MKSSIKDQIKGKAREVFGHAKKHAGEAMDRPDIEDKGREEQVQGTVQRKVGEVKKVFGH
jgi:uncharacterized protein YjbJ (UPF0337 family)